MERKFRRIYLILCHFCLFQAFFSFNSAISQENFDDNSELLRQNKISDPSIGANCRELLNQRDEKITHKQKLGALLLRSENMLKKAPKERASIITKLKITRDGVSRELKLAQIKIENMEEKIIRSGCPGITLQTGQEERLKNLNDLVEAPVQMTEEEELSELR